MKVVNLAVFKEAKQNKQFRDRIRQEKKMRLYNIAEKAMSNLGEDDMQELAGAIYDGDEQEVNEKISKLICKGSVFSFLDNALENYELSM